VFIRKGVSPDFRHNLSPCGGYAPERRQRQYQEKPETLTRLHPIAARQEAESWNQRPGFY
jgi:hypothetical protein